MATDPSNMIHFESATGIMREICRAHATTVTDDPREVTCPACNNGLQRLADFCGGKAPLMQMLENLAKLQRLGREARERLDTEEKD
jgi:hypothetical protein